MATMAMLNNQMVFLMLKRNVFEAPQFRLIRGRRKSPGVQAGESLVN